MGASLRKSVFGDDYNLEILSLVWLDASVNSTTENIDVQQQLRSYFTHLKIFDNTNESVVEKLINNNKKRIKNDM